MVIMTNWLYFAERAGATVLWSCTVTGCPAGNYLDDPQGHADHQAVYGHSPVAGRPLCPVAAVGT
jgi:hypothetical protein